MRHPIAKIASVAAAATLAGGLFATAPAAAAPSAAPAAAPAAVSAKDQYSYFDVKVTYPKRVKRGGKITYTIRIKNRGPHYADFYFLGGKLPKGIQGKIYYSGVKGTKCGVLSGNLWCWGPDVLPVGKTDWLKLTVKLKKSTKGYAHARLGVLHYDLPTGTEDLSLEAIQDLGIDKANLDWLRVKTRIVR